MSADDEEATPVHLGIWSRQKNDWWDITNQVVSPKAPHEYKRVVKRGLLASVYFKFKPVLQSRLASEEHHRGNQEIGNKGKGGDSRVKFHEPIAFFSSTSLRKSYKNDAD